ncbi:hypothetical protein PC39_04905 [Salinisphaera sp. PC39]
MQFVKVQDSIKPVHSTFGRFCRKIQILLVALWTEHTALSTDKTVQQDHTLGIRRLLNKRVIVESENIDSLQVQRARQQFANKVFVGQKPVFLVAGWQ